MVLNMCFINLEEDIKTIDIEALKSIAKSKNINVDEKANFGQLLDKIFLKVLKNNPEKMPKIFYDMFQGSSNKVIKFLSNKSNFFDDLSIIMKMPKLLFLKALI